MSILPFSCVKSRAAARPRYGGKAEPLARALQTIYPVLDKTPCGSMDSAEEMDCEDAREGFCITCDRMVITAPQRSGYPLDVRIYNFDKTKIPVVASKVIRGCVNASCEVILW